MKVNRFFILFLVLIAATGSIFAQSISTLKWQVGYHSLLADEPKRWYNSTVPGAVQLDIMFGENYKQPYWFGNNFEQFTWMEKYNFTYKTSFTKPTTSVNDKVFFVSKGIDYEFFITLNGNKIHSQEGMFTPVKIDITSFLKENNELKITILPVQTVAGGRNTIWHYRDHARNSAKPAVSYGWDWHPRLIVRGIWDETYLEVKNEVLLNSANVDYELISNYSSAKVKLEVDGSKLAEASFKWVFRNPDGSVAFSKEGRFKSDRDLIVTDLNSIKLWWPNGYGKQDLYESTLELFLNGKLLEKKISKVGFRKIKMIMNEGGWIEPQMFPKSRSVAPANFEVNGKRIFAKGSNWVHPEIFPGIMSRGTYETQIKLAKEANFNIFRVWGGGITNKESFFDLCDQYGILVWQEFPLACNNYPDDEGYLKVLEQEAKSIISKCKSHASLALWCGGNELFNEWSGMTEQSKALRLLNKLCYDLDPKTPFIYTSPLEGMGHGHYVFFEKANGGEVFQWMPKSKNTAYTEFGVPGTANLDVLKSFIPAAELFPPKLGTAWESHHAFFVWGQHRWLELPFLEEYFGKITTIEDLVAYSQLTQCEGYKCIFEEARRQKPYCGMAINWCYQEPWPCAANNSLINWPSKPKPALYHVGKACRPVLASARIPKFRWDEGEEFSCDLFILNDSYEKISSGLVSAKLVYDDGQELSIINWNFPGTDEAKNYNGPTGRLPLPKMKSNLFKLVVEVEGKPEYKSEYTFVYRGKDVKNAKPKIQYMNGVTE